MGTVGGTGEGLRGYRLPSESIVGHHRASWSMGDCDGPVGV